MLIIFLPIQLYRVRAPSAARVHVQRRAEINKIVLNACTLHLHDPRFAGIPWDTQQFSSLSSPIPTERVGDSVTLHL